MHVKQLVIDALHEALAYSVSIKPEGVCQNASGEMEKKSVRHDLCLKKYSFGENFLNNFILR